MRSFLTLPLAAVLTAGLVLAAPATSITPSAANELPSSAECTPDPRFDKSDFRGM